MKEKFWNWWNKPITWGASIKASVWAYMIGTIGTWLYFVGIAKLNKELASFKQRTSEDVTTAKRKSNYFEVDKNVEE